MPNLNKVTLMGYLGQDPMLRSTPNGVYVCSFTMATAERWKDRDGIQQERTEWHNIELWGKTAELAAQYLRKGSPVYIEGKLKTESWEDNEGTTRKTTKVVGREMQFLEKKEE